MRYLTPAFPPAYTPARQQTTDDGFGDPECIAAKAATVLPCGYFFAHGAPSMGGLGGEAARPAGSDTRFANPAQCRPPRLATRQAVRSNELEYRTMAIALQAREQRAVFRALRILDTHLKQPEVALGNPNDCRDYLRLRFAGLQREEFIAIWLNSQNRMIGSETISVGTINQTAVYPREVAKSALLANARSVIFAHNHPGGSTEPSQADIDLTKTLKKSLSLIDVDLLDHFVVTEATATSLAERGHV